jgi:hypothetical protein
VCVYIILFSQTSSLFLLCFGPPVLGLRRSSHLVAFDLFLFDKILPSCTVYKVCGMQILADPILLQQSLLRKNHFIIFFPSCQDVHIWVEMSGCPYLGILFNGKTLPPFCFFLFFSVVMFCSSNP